MAASSRKENDAKGPKTEIETALSKAGKKIAL
jgi:hypothetical protein